MARRKGRKVLPFPGQQSKKPLATLKLSDRQRLMLEKGMNALDGVVQQANVAFDELVRAVMATADCDPEEGWMFNRQKMQWEKHPVATDA